MKRTLGDIHIKKKNLNIFQYQALFKTENMATNGITIALVITLCFHDSSSFISSNVVRRHEINDVYTFPSASRRKHARRSLWKMAVADETDLKRGSVKDDKALFGKSEDSALLKLDDGEGYMGDLTKMLKEPEDFRILGKSSANSEGEVNLMASGIILAVGAVAAAMSMSSITFEGLGIRCEHYRRHLVNNCIISVTG